MPPERKHELLHTAQARANAWRGIKQEIDKLMALESRLENAGETVSNEERNQYANLEYMISLLVNNRK